MERSRSVGFRHWFALRPAAALSAVSAMRLARVAAVFAWRIHSRMPLRVERGKAAKASAAPGRAAKACCRSSGVSSRSTASSALQVPSAFAASIRARPAAVIRPAVMRRSTLVLFSADQRLRGFRGETSSIERLPSSERGRLSIQPKQSASSHTSTAVGPGRPLPLRGSTTQTEADSRWCATSQARHASREAGSTRGRSAPARLKPPSSTRRPGRARPWNSASPSRPASARA